MNRRLLTLALTASLLMPGLALADASADGLGPASTQGGGSSSADASALQPAGADTVQPNVNSSGLTGSTGDAATLQQPATSDNTNLQVLLNGDGDGAPQNTATSLSIWWYVVSGLLGLGIVALGIWIWNRRTSQLVVSSKLSAAGDTTGPDVDENKPAPGESEATVAETESESIPASESISEPTPTEEPETTSGVVATEAAADGPSNTDTDVQNDETVPPIVSDSSNKPGDDSGKHPDHTRQKGRKHGKKRSKR